MFKVKLLSVVVALACSAIASGSIPGLIESEIVKVDGSSTVFPITEAVAEEFQKTHPNIKVTVGISGTGGGFKKFCRGETHISDASRPIKGKEIKLAGENGVDFIEIPVAYDGLAVIVNKDNTWCNSMTVAELKKLWEPGSKGKINKWSDIRPEWPNRKIRLYGPGTDSGTFDYFTEAICGDGGASRPDYVASEDDNVLVIGIARDIYALGYFGLAYYEHNKDTLKLVAIDDEDDSNGKGAIIPTLETVTNGTYTPLSRPIFIYVSTHAAKLPYVREFVRFYLKNAKELVKEAGYIPLSDTIYKLLLERFEKGITGTVYKTDADNLKSIEKLFHHHGNKSIKDCEQCKKS